MSTKDHQAGPGRLADGIDAEAEKKEQERPEELADDATDLAERLSAWADSVHTTKKESIR